MQNAESGCGRDEFVELQRKVQRMELLLFRSDEPTFEKLDEFISKLLHEPAEDNAAAHEIPNTCEVFSLCDPIIDVSEVVVPASTSLEQCSSILAESRLDAISAQVAGLIGRLQSTEDVLAPFADASYVERSALPSVFASDVLPSLTMVINEKFDAYDERVRAVETFVPLFHERFDKVMNMVDRLTNTGLANISSALKPKQKSKR